jgi:predicted membrane protein
LNSWIELLATPVGLVGVVLILVSYFLLQMHKWSNRSLSYSMVNLIGSVLILLSLMVHFNLASVIIEIMWIGISLYGVMKALRRSTV